LSPEWRRGQVLAIRLFGDVEAGALEVRRGQEVVAGGDLPRRGATLLIPLACTYSVDGRTKEERHAVAMGDGERFREVVLNLVPVLREALARIAEGWNRDLARGEELVIFPPEAVMDNTLTPRDIAALRDLGQYAEVQRLIRKAALEFIVQKVEQGVPLSRFKTAVLREADDLEALAELQKVPEKGRTPEHYFNSCLARTALAAQRMAAMDVERIPSEALESVAQRVRDDFAQAYEDFVRYRESRGGEISEGELKLEALLVLGKEDIPPAYLARKERYRAISDWVESLRRP